MNKIDIVYVSKTGHSKKLARAIGKALGVKSQDAAKNTSPCQAELVFIVGGIYGGISSPEMLSYVGSMTSEKVKKAVLVTSSVLPNQKSQPQVKAILDEKGIEVVDEINCPGSFLLMQFGHPNASDVKGIVTRAGEIAQQI